MSRRMRSPLMVLVVALLAVAASGVSGCARAGRGAALGNPVSADSGVTLVVRNDNFSDVDVWVISYGLPTRLGVVMGSSSQRFQLDPTVTLAPDLRFVATPIGGNGRANSGPVVVQPGQTIEFRIGLRLRLSTVSVR